MSYSEEIRQNPGQDTYIQEEGFFEAFGQQFTSKVIGTFLAIAGIAGGVAIWWTQVRPVREENKTLTAELNAKEGELAAQGIEGIPAEIIALEEERDEAERIAKEVLDAYGLDEQMETFLLDFNRALRAGNVQLARYEPASPKPVFIEDTSYGAAAQNQLKRQTFNVGFENMTYPEAEAMLSNIDLLQPLLVLRNFSTNIDEPATYRYRNGQLIPQTSARLGVSFEVDALIAPTPEEVAQQQAAIAAAPTDTDDETTNSLPETTNDIEEDQGQI